MSIALEWDGKQYHEYELPEGATTFEDDMDKEISCCKCGRKVKYGDCYTSRTIHTIYGIGYAECEECYFANEERENNDR